MVGLSGQSATRGDRRAWASPGPAGYLALLALPGALTVYLGFSSGGYLPDATGVAAVVLIGALILRITLAARPLAGISAAVLIPISALTLFAIWTLVSALWSQAPSRALLEFDRVLLYLFALVLLGSVPRTTAGLEWAVRCFAAGAAVVCLAGLASRLAPDLLVSGTGIEPDRLSYPLSYWNSLGLLAAIGILVCLHLASGRGQPALVRALGAATVPLLASCLLLTFSRGAMVVLLLAIALYAALARPWGLLLTVVVVTPAALFALDATYGAELLVNGSKSAAAIAQGHSLAATLALCALGAGALRFLLASADSSLERRASRRRAERGAPRPLALGMAAGALVLLVVATAIVLDAPTLLREQSERFATGYVPESRDVRDRLASASSNGRLDNWKAALEGYSEAPLAGQGAGTYQVTWSRLRGVPSNAVDAHSLYLEVLAELGVVGLALLAAALAALLVGLVARVRGPDRGVYAVLAAATVAWALRAGIDWDWEMPAVTLWLFALGGLALAAPRREPSGRGPAGLTRVVAALGCALLAITPALAALSQERLAAAIMAFKRGDCRASSSAAVDSIDYLAMRPQPLELLAYCDVRAGLPELAQRTMEKALARDPHNWEYHYGLAIVRAAGGADPRPQAAVALRLNPLSPLAQATVKAFDTDDPAKWKRRAVTARLPIPP